jgi:hypothetical protein
MAHESVRAPLLIPVEGAVYAPPSVVDVVSRDENHDYEEGFDDARRDVAQQLAHPYLSQDPTSHHHIRPYLSETLGSRPLSLQ